VLKDGRKHDDVLIDKTTGREPKKARKTMSKAVAAVISTHQTRYQSG
jgi:hypothetical protein